MAHHDHDCCGSNTSISQELATHFPFAVFSVAAALGVLSFVSFTTNGFAAIADRLFHSFHFMHIVFASTGTVLTFGRFSKNIWGSIIVGTIVPSIFCVLSDSILPYLGGRLFGVDMVWHLCFRHELHNILPFLFVGILNGFIMSRSGERSHEFHSIFSHFVHILVSSFASLFYLISHGFQNWHSSIGFVFLFLIGAVVVPCTLSDVVVPIFFARVKRNNEKHSS